MVYWLLAAVDDMFSSSEKGTPVGHLHQSQVFSFSAKRGLDHCSEKGVVGNLGCYFLILAVAVCVGVGGIEREIRGEV